MQRLKYKASGPATFKFRKVLFTGSTECTCQITGSATCPCHQGLSALTSDDMDNSQMVLGQYPKGFLNLVLSRRMLGTGRRQDILHICSGALHEPWTVDMRIAMHPRVVADGTALPFKDQSFPAIMLDPPYYPKFAEKRYDVKLPSTAALLREAARVCLINGRIGMLHYMLPNAPVGCKLVDCLGVTTGGNMSIRAFTIWRKLGHFSPESAKLLSGERRA